MNLQAAFSEALEFNTAPRRRPVHVLAQDMRPFDIWFGEAAGPFRRVINLTVLTSEVEVVRIVEIEWGTRLTHRMGRLITVTVWRNPLSRPVTQAEWLSAKSAAHSKLYRIRGLEI